MAKAGKGTVVVRVVKDRLRLVWTFGSDRYFLSLGLPDTAINRSAADLKARLIERDIALENFDRSLEKYKLHGQSQPVGITVAQLFDRFVAYKTGKIDPRTLEKYAAVRVRVLEYFEERSALTVTEREADRFKNWLLERQAAITVQDRLSIMRSCWVWGIKQGLLKENPWLEVKLKVPPKQAPNPFALEEVRAILTAFRESRYYDHYADFMEFLFGTGCRTGEAIGLRWKHLSENCDRVWIGEIVTRGNRKATKTNKDRTVPLTQRLQGILLERKQRLGKIEPDGLVFPSPQGNPIHDCNFRNRPWTKILEQCGIEYRKPYLSRSTLASHALAQGMSPVEVSELTGHSVAILFKHYAGTINKAKLPELF